MSFKIEKATRVGVTPLIGAYGESGTGKTMSALLLARGFVGPQGSIVLIDTENRRGSFYSDVIPGGFGTIQLQEPFSPARYMEAIQAAEDGGAQIIVIDSMSHEHEGIGGVLDMAADNESRSGRPGLHNWKTPKMEHAKLMQRLMRSRVPVICCIRAKYKTRQKKDERGKAAIVKDDFTSPIQAEDFIFEMTAHFETMPDHTIHLTKCSHPSLRDCFPEDYKEPISIKHGELIAKWANGPGYTPSPQPQSAPSTTARTGTDPLKIAKSKFWLAMKEKYQTPSDLEADLQATWKLQEGETLSSLTLDRLIEVAASVGVMLP